MSTWIPTCENCDAEVTTCTCGETETYEIKDGPSCPYCGRINKASDSGGMLYTEDADQYKCESCEKNFTVSVRISYAWTARRK